ncbi:hypothetical protein AVEN_170922-1 [Araneus ventricosus]|uniref:Uncharacterized protein n=1 Tax=Araneus ventricosus TaxID=182803 RepID=A0A4Y2JCW2_ARAVE|nr:hypothetical protein AVEN_170922-1 [Araneus ventricosus]
MSLARDGMDEEPQDGHSPPLRADTGLEYEKKTCHNCSGEEKRIRYPKPVIHNCFTPRKWRGGTPLIPLILVLLTSCFEATRGLFWDGPRNSEPRPDDEDGIRAGAPSPTPRTAPTGERLAPFL